jgi:voltage-gated sodium channel
MTAATVDGAPKAAKAKSNAKGGIPLFRWLTQNPVWEFTILACIIANAIALGLDANYGDGWTYHHLVENLDTYFLWIFTIELVCEFLAQGARRYFTNGWNIFDVFIIGICWVAIVGGDSPGALSALRTLRILRVLRLVSAVPQMRRVVEALFGAMPGILATSAILAVVFYIGAVMATTLFHSEEGFRSLPESALSLFALTQFDGWGETVARLNAINPYAWIFMLGFNIVAAFAVLNLFIGVIVDAVQETRAVAIEQDIDEIKEDVDAMRVMKTEIQEDVSDIAEAQEDATVIQKAMLDELRALRAELAAVKASNIVK